MHSKQKELLHNYGPTIKLQLTATLSAISQFTYRKKMTHLLPNPQKSRGQLEVNNKKENIADDATLLRK